MQFAKARRSGSVDIDGFLAGLSTAQYGGYGGNTACVEIRSAKQQIIIDGGSGIRLLGREMALGPCGRGKGEAHILFTHFHWDHLVGLPFFVPIFVPGNTIHVYSVQPRLKDVFRTVFQKPYFPIPLESLGSRLVYHSLMPRKKSRIGDIEVTPYRLDHPDPCWGFKVEHDGKTYAHCADTECLRVSRAELGADLPLYQQVDLMSFDAQYTMVEKFLKVNWGHATASVGLDIAMREGIKQVLFTHHETNSDEKIAELEAEVRHYYDMQMKMSSEVRRHLTEVTWQFSHDGLEVVL